MKVVAINRFYAPDESATAQMLRELAEHLAARGSRVAIVTSRQRYDDPGAKLAEAELREGVLVHRVWTTRFGRQWLPGRSIDYLTFYVSAFVAALRLARPGDVILAKTDPPLISVVTWLAARLRGARLVNWCQDLFPEVAAALGLRWAGGPVGLALRALRNCSLRGAATNVVLCERMAEHLVGQGVPRGRIVVVHNWADGAAIRPIPPERNPLRREWGLVGRRVIGYSGNLGRAHDLPAVQTFVAAMSEADPELVFLFVGGGAGLEPLTRWARARGLRNLVTRPYQPRERLAESLSVPDLHLVSLAPACEGLIMPSKLYGALAAGRPVVVLGDPEGTAASLVRRLEAGLPWRPEKERDVLRALEQGRDEVRVLAIRRAFERGFDRHHGLEHWAALLEETAPVPRAAQASKRAA